MKPRQLGVIQQAVLDALLTRKQWYLGCGWTWDTPAHTTQLMESLVKRGDATVQRGVLLNGFTRDIYRPVRNRKRGPT